MGQASAYSGRVRLEKRSDACCPNFSVACGLTLRSLCSPQHRGWGRPKRERDCPPVHQVWKLSLPNRYASGALGKRPREVAGPGRRMFHSISLGWARHEPVTTTCGAISTTALYKFTGKERDSESGLDNFGARYNSSSIGRFMSPDPLGAHQQDPQTLNKYVYVRNNPTSPIRLVSISICRVHTLTTMAGGSPFSGEPSGVAD